MKLEIEITDEQYVAYCEKHLPAPKVSGIAEEAIVPTTDEEKLKYITGFITNIVVADADNHLIEKAGATAKEIKRAEIEANKPVKK